MHVKQEMFFVIPSHTTVTTVSPIMNVYLDWLRLFITKVEPGVSEETEED